MLKVVPNRNIQFIKHSDNYWMLAADQSFTPPGMYDLQFDDELHSIGYEPVARVNTPQADGSSLELTFDPHNERLISAIVISDTEFTPVDKFEVPENHSVLYQLCMCHHHSVKAFNAERHVAVKAPEPNFMDLMLMQMERAVSKIGCAYRTQVVDITETQHQRLNRIIDKLHDHLTVS